MRGMDRQVEFGERWRMSSQAQGIRNLLHVGCGPKTQADTHPTFHDPRQWAETRLDIDPAAQPDIVASMTDMATVDDGRFDAIFSSHNLEHLYPHEVPTALAEFRRVLKPTGFALVVVPDLQRVGELIAANKLEDPAYMSPSGPICPVDMLYGFRPSLAAGNLFMAHRMGFTRKTLAQYFLRAGFATVTAQRDGFDLFALGYRSKPQTAAQAPSQVRLRRALPV
jgi:SAM-dependent methyltransferase